MRMTPLQDYTEIGRVQTMARAGRINETGSLHIQKRHSPRAVFAPASMKDGDHQRDPAIDDDPDRDRCPRDRDPSIVVTSFAAASERGGDGQALGLRESLVPSGTPSDRLHEAAG